MKWISVKDKLPEVLQKDKDRNRTYVESKPVLITTGENRMYVAMLVGWSDENPEQWSWDIEVDGVRSYCCGSIITEEYPVTHWIELPEGPNDES